MQREISHNAEMAEAIGAPDLIKALECPICNSIPIPPIYGCINGHIICNDCRPNLAHCGICRQPFWEGRNLVIESIVLGSKFYCNYKNDGCNQIILGNDLKKHLMICEFGPKIEEESESILEADITVASGSSAPEASVNSAGSSVGNGSNSRTAPPAYFQWIPCRNGDFPANAIRGGTDEYGGYVYVARANHEGGIIPGKFNGRTRQAFIPWGGAEHEKIEYEVLTGRLEFLDWIPAALGDIPPFAVPGGPSETGEMLFIGRTRLNGHLITGKVHPSHGVCYISQRGEELGKQFYEVLVRRINVDGFQEEEDPWGITADHRNEFASHTLQLNPGGMEFHDFMEQLRSTLDDLP